MENKIIKLGENFEIDLDKLISTRMLIQANSGAGKSYAIRKLLEESHGQVQHIVIDLEGEFASLREKYDYLLVGPNGEIPARIQTAEILAKKLMKLGVSTIIDLSELKHHERILFVKRFLDAMVDLPRTSDGILLWHSCLVVIDEAHQFCPEKSKSESGSSVIDLCTRGRKRGYCAVLATQRISKLNKDAAAECNNQMVGRTLLDIDQKRAADTLGITDKKEIRNLRNMDDGQFRVFGPAIGREVNDVQVGLTKTVHLDAKQNISKPTPTPKNIAKIMKDVIDLPKEAETELKNLSDYKNKVVELKREVRRLEHSKPKPEVDEKSLERARQQGFREAQKQLVDEIRKEHDSLRKAKLAYDRMERGVQQIATNCSKLLQIESPKIVPIQPPSSTHPVPKVILREVTEIHRDSPEIMPTDIVEGEVKLGLCSRKIYSVLYNNSDREFTKVQMALLSGYSIKSGSFNNSLAQLKSMGLMRRNNGKVSLGESSSEYASEPFQEISKELWGSKMGLCSRKIFDFLLVNANIEFSKDEIATNVSYSVTSGSFNNSLAQLNSLGFAQRSNGLIKLNPEILEL